MIRVNRVRVRFYSYVKLLIAAIVALGVATTGVALATAAPAFAAGPPVVANGYGAFTENPIVNLTGCTATTSVDSLTCASTAGVVVGMDAYGVGLNTTTSNQVVSVSGTTIGLGSAPSATITTGETETFTNASAMADVNGSTTSTTLTEAASVPYEDYGIDAGMAVYGAGIAAGTTVVSVSTGETLVLSQDPTAALSAETVYFNSPDINNVLTQVTGGATNVNTASITVVSQPPADDGFVTTSNTSTTGLVTMYPDINPVDSTFTATFAYCAPTYTYPNPSECTTATETYGTATQADMGDQLSINAIIETITENIYEDAASAHFGPSTASTGQTITMSTAPVGASIPVTSGGATVSSADGDTSITPVPSGLTYVPGSLTMSGGDATTSAAGAVTAKYCTAAGTGCTAQMTGNFKTTYPYIEEQLGTATADQTKGGALQTLPGITASFVVTGDPQVSNSYLTEFLVNINATDIISVNINFDGYPTSGDLPYCSSSCQNGESENPPPYAAPSPISSLTITPAVTGTSTANGNDNGADTGGQTVQISGAGFTNAGGEQVYFGANPATSFTVNSDTSITAIAPASTTGDGPVDVTVSNGGFTSPINAPADQFTYIPAGAPDAPQNVTTTSDNGQAEVSWTPGFNEGSPTEFYTVTATDVSSPSNDPNNGGAGLETCTYTVPVGGDGPTDGCTVPGLTNGDSYTFQITATNALGTSVPSAATTPLTVGYPAAPTGVTATGAQDGTSTVSWTDPVNTGAGPLLSETVTASPGGQTCTYLESSGPPDQCTVSGLTDGTSYTFTAASTNYLGTGVSSAASSAIVPSAVPGAPTIGTATSNANAQSAVSFTAPASNGGATISSYTVSAADTTNPSNPVVTQSGAASPITVTGLNNGDTYSFTVTATNVSGTGAASAATTATPATVPGAPTGVTTATGPPVASGDVAVSWTPPLSNGGATIDKYTVTSSNSKTCTATSTPPAVPLDTCTVTGETNGTAYTFTVTATNASGTGAASSPAVSATPTAVPATPSAPTVTVAGLNGQANLTWTAPNNEGSTLTQYTLTPTPACSACTGLTVTGSPPTASTTVAGLTNGTSYTFTLVATNGDGNSAASSASTAAVVGIPATPTAPTTTPTSTSGQDSVSWTAPASASGPITSYTLTPSPACSACTGLTVTGSPAATSTTVGGLTNGTSYTFTLKATNASGTSAASAASTGEVTGAPTAPTGVTAAGGIPAASGALIVTWTAPSSPGIDPITSYTATSSSGSKTCAWSTGPLTCTITGLTNGTAYTVSVTATNSAGTAYKSIASAASNTAYPSTTFGAPTIGTATAGYQQATVSWTAPTALAGTQPALTGYVVTPYIGTTAQTAQTFNTTTTTETVTGLTADTAYTFEVAAINANGTGTYSAKSTSVTPSGTPSAPTGVTATLGDQTATVTWTDGASNGSTTLSYTVTATDTSASPNDPTDGGETCTYTVAAPEVDSCTFSGADLLTNGDSYTFTVTGTNANGTGPASAASNSVTPSTLPDAPTGVNATAGDSSATVSWTASSGNGAPIEYYTVTATGDGGNESCMGYDPTDSCTVTGLSNGTSYTFTVTATNTDGTSSASDASAAVVPSTVPDAPGGVTAAATNHGAVVSWTASYDEGSTVEYYTVSDGQGDTCTGTDPSDSCTVTGLSNGDDYTFTVTATNADGTGAASSASNTVVPAAVPDAPTGATATAGDSSATVSWTPGFDEGSTIEYYTVSDGQGDTCTGTDPSDSCTVTGLTNNDSYTFTVTATNANGTGVASTASNSVTPSTVPDAPTGPAATPGDSSATVSWTPGFDEGSTIEYYTVSDGQGDTCTGYDPTDSCTVTGLTNNDSYTFTVTATNANGTGAASTLSNSITPSTVPDAPTGATASAGDATATVSWTPGFDEGSTIEDYTVSDGQGHTCTGTDPSDSCTVTGLTNGDSYTFTVTATNADGTGAASTASNSVTPSSNTAGFTSAPTVTIAAGHALNFTITTSGTPKATVSATGVPAWITFTPGTGQHKGTAKIHGTGPTSGGSYTLTVHANNGMGPDITQVLTVDVLAITSPASASFTKGIYGTFTIQTSGVPSGVALTATISAHLHGLTFRDNGDGTATLYGTPASTDRTTNVTVKATFGSLHITQHLMVNIG